MKEFNAFIKKLQEQPALSKGLLFVILIALFIPHWIYFYHNINNSIGPDLLLRTIGSRLQEAGKPIYEYKWKPGDPPGWLNPYEDTRIGLNGVVSTPFLLWLFQPLAQLNYCNVRIIWDYTQEVFLFSTVWFCCWAFRQLFLQLAFIAVAALFFLYGRNWLLNLYNGQMYIIYAFVFALSGYVIKKYKNHSLILALYPLITLIRPFFATAIIPILKTKKRYLLCVAASTAFTLIITTTTTAPGEWNQYKNAMKLYAKEQTGELAIGTTSPRLYWQYADSCTKTSEAAFKIFGAGCLYSLQHYLYLLGFPVSNLLVFQVILAMSFLIVLFVAYKKNWLKDVDKQLLLSFLFYQLCELITPASRNPYTMIQWIAPVAWLIASGNKPAIWLVVAGLCLNHDIPFRFKYEREIGEALLFVAVIVFLFRKNNRIWDGVKA